MVKKEKESSVKNLGKPKSRFIFKNPMKQDKPVVIKIKEQELAEYKSRFFKF